LYFPAPFHPVAVAGAVPGTTGSLFAAMNFFSWLS
jgi:hypothetical protein